MFRHEFEVRFTLKSIPQIKLLFEWGVKIDDFEIEVQDGKIVGKTSISIDVDDLELAKRQAIDKIEELTTILTLTFGTPYKVDDISVVHKPIIKKTESGQTLSIFDTVHITEQVVIIQKIPTEFIEEQYYLWRDKLSKLKDKEVLLRALKWWRRGSLDEDNVDRFLHYFITLEMLASLIEKKFEEVCNEAGITYRPDGRHSLKWVRNKLLHSVGEEKEIAEKLAKNYADILGNEIFHVIKKILEGQMLNT
jgi:hypothetical protein